MATIAARIQTMSDLRASLQTQVATLDQQIALLTELVNDPDVVGQPAIQTYGETPAEAPVGQTQPEA